MNKAVVVGLTGGMGSGKSQARRYWQALGVPCLDADEVAHDILDSPGHVALAELKQAFPEVFEGKKLQRGNLRALIARRPESNARLIAVLQPHVLSRLQQWTFRQASGYVVWESALMSAAGVAVDHLVEVRADEHLRLQRVRARNPDWPLAHATALLALQEKMPARPADDVVDNNGSPVLLRQQVEALHATYLRKWRAI